MEEKPKAGRPSIYDPKYCDMIIEAMRDGKSMLSFAASIGVARSTLNHWIDNRPDFADAVDRAKTAQAAWWETQLCDTASGRAKGDARLIIFGLSNAGALEWRDKQEIDHRSGDGSMSPKGSSLDEFYAAANVPAKS